MSRRSGLGKGLNALIPTDGPAERSEETSALREVPVSSIEPNRRQPRSMFDEESLALYENLPLKDSVKDKWLYQNAARFFRV